MSGVSPGLDLGRRGTSDRRCSGLPPQAGIAPVNPFKRPLLGDPDRFFRRIEPGKITLDVHSTVHVIVVDRSVPGAHGQRISQRKSPG